MFFKLVLLALISGGIAENTNDDLSFDDSDEISVRKWSFGEISRVKREESKGFGSSTTVQSITPTPTLPTTAVPVPPQNSPPVAQKIPEKLAVNAGSVFIYEIPRETFRDSEDGDTKSLRVALKNQNGTELPDESWIGFNSIKQTINAMPLEKDIGSYKFILEATDSSGAKASDLIDFVVEQDPLSRTFHHKFAMQFIVDPNSTEGFNKEPLLLYTIKQLSIYFDGQEQIGKHMYLHDYSFEPLTITWTNRSLNTKICPSDEIEYIMKQMIDVNNEIVPELEGILAPQLHVKSANVTYSGICQYTDYIFTFIVPGVIIAAMLVIAMIIAFFLYRRQRSVKICVEENQNFMLKEIPVTFAEELDEKQDPPAKLMMCDESQSGIPKHSPVSPMPEQREFLPRNGGSDRYPSFIVV